MRIRMFATAFAVAVIAAIPLAGTASGQDTKNCDDFTYQEDAQAEFEKDRSDPHGLDDYDGKGDGIACESLPRRPVTENNSSGSSDQVKTVPRGGVDTGDGTTTSAPVLITVVGAAAAAGIGGFAARRAASSSR